MQTPRDFDESQAMHGIAVALLTEDREQLVVLQNRLESTHVARIVFSHLGSPSSTTDSIVRQMQDQRAEVVLVEVNAENPQRAIHAIELIRATTSGHCDLRVGEIAQPRDHRGVPCELARVNRGSHGRAQMGFWRPSPVTPPHAARPAAPVRPAFSRSSTRKAAVARPRWRSNTAVALQQNHGQTILVDFSPIGHAALHLNARPSFSVIDALQNLHRMDASLLEGLMTSTKDGLHSAGCTAAALRGGSRGRRTCPFV